MSADEDSLFLRRAESKDIPQISYIHLTCWKELYSEHFSKKLLDKFGLKYRLDLWSNALSKSSCTAFVIEYKMKVVGFISCSKKTEDIAEVTSLYILKENRVKGGGKLLFNFLKETLQKDGFTKIFLYTEVNSNSNFFYKKLDGIIEGSCLMDFEGEKIKVNKYVWAIQK